MNLNSLPFGLWIALLINTFSTVTGEDIFINPWELRAPNLPYDDLNATVGDTITFFWPQEENHTVYINPTGNCDDTGGILVGSSSPASYTFTEVDANNSTLGKAVFFADNIAQLCEWGMRFFVEVLEAPSASPTNSPTLTPTAAPTNPPTLEPTAAPTNPPTLEPTAAPTNPPTLEPTAAPTTSSPSSSPTKAPTGKPSTAPSVSTSQPTVAITETASASPTVLTKTPTTSPSNAPSIVSSSNVPTSAPSKVPSGAPIVAASTGPSSFPTNGTSTSPTVKSTNTPSTQPTTPPVPFPTPSPTLQPTMATTAVPTVAPTASPTATPTAAPTKIPTKTPTEKPTAKSTVIGGGEKSPTDPPVSEMVSKIVTGLQMGIAGITELPSDAQLEWQELTESFSTSYVFNDLKDSVSNFVTKYEVNNVTPITLQQQRHTRMLRWKDQSSRSLQNQESQGIIVEYTQSIQYFTADRSEFTPDLMVSLPFSTVSDRTAYVTLLKTSSDSVLSQVKGVSEIQVPASTPTQAPSSTAPMKKDAVLTKPAIIGIACGGAGLLILIVLFCIYCRSGGGDENGDGKSSGEPPLHVDVRDDEVSTLAGPNGPPTYGDQSVATMDYDYSKAYGGAGDTSVSSAGGTFGSNTQNISFPTNATATGAALGAMDDDSYNAQYDDPRAIRGKEEVIHIFAPPGKLGVVIDTPDDGAPVVHAVKDTSVIADRIIVGDKLVAVDDEDVTSMTAIKVSKMISRKGANPSRKLTIVRTMPIEE